MWDKATILRKLEVPQREEEADVWKTSRWLNRDNVPLPPSRRTWGAWSFVGYWVATGVNISGWTAGSSLLSLGLTVGEAMAVVVIGQLLVAGCVILTGLFGAQWHVGFPMWNRVVWGIRASFFPLANRIVLSFTWCACQAWFGGQVLKTLLGSIWPSIYNMHNSIPASSNLTSVDFMCFMLFLLISLPLLYIPPEHYRKPFLFTAASSTITAFALFFYSLAKGHGAGPLIKSTAPELTGTAQVYGSALGWAMVYGISSSQLGGICAGILNMSDYSRFAVKPGDQILSQAVIVPVMGTITCLIGIVCTSVAAQTYPDDGLMWEPYQLLTAIQNNGGRGARAAVFFASLAFLISQFGINIAGNAISGGIDLASLLPKYINIRRGAYITTIMALPMCPWALLSGATVFLSVMSGYATFLGPMTGLMVFDYIFVRRQKVKLSALYNASPSSIYYYWKGVNWRAPVAWVIGVAPVFPGFLASVSTVTVSEGAQKMYYLCFPAGFVISGTVYLAFCKIWPVPGVGEVDAYDIFGTFGEPGTQMDGFTDGPVYELARAIGQAAYDEKDEKDVAMVVPV
ncbi:permease for cytosine/purines, uracil, thiamine, allantoin-domain-containing protein [Naematelia encephala]|uniref:Permease for cytosine/purines, uracil, thiamine, allantoin-domain-containing protein n=1 Tax=Naematelia encephala TaxID=71784 RepID=A0A1Y2B7F8_9TREE|nr:permease for cytosine/purines, uracil, thiamine, allantoin-domain-containing protein [Naematelia encephala]